MSKHMKQSGAPGDKSTLSTFSAPAKPKIHYRHEWKHQIAYVDFLSIRSRLRAVAEADSHAIDGKYLIRSLYFDTPYDKALREKIDGVNMREKFRIRYYNHDTSFIHLEKKSKRNGLGTKYSALLSAEEAQAIVDGNISWMADTDRALVQELYCKMRYQNLAPKTIVDYTREPYIYRPGNVRVTFDYNLRTGLGATDFLNPSCVTIPAGDTPILLEVKWDEYLPSIIRDCVQTPARRVTAFSKYAQCRIYG
ncbi:MAG: polyphosphate polymerase domain-containing protein [Coriobacteriales bacterium]|nr:polyphosphate polymerase domain-containing protein [Coriobacteriales bacterium]